MFADSTGFLKRYRAVVEKLMIRDREIFLWTGKGLSMAQAEAIASPTKPEIARMHSVSLATVQNVHRVMRESYLAMTQQRA